MDLPRIFTRSDTVAAADDVELARSKSLATATESTVLSEDRDSDDDEDNWPSEYTPLNWKKLYTSWKYLPLHLFGMAMLVLTILLSVKHAEAVAALRPFSQTVRGTPGGWVVPIAVLFVISFPPLFGHEIVALLVGAVYGLWAGFGIVAAGTFLGEIGNWFAFRWLLRSRAEGMERKNLGFAALTRLTRDRGFWMVFIIRFSAIPTHFTTAVFSICGVKFWHFALATFLTLPKQVFLVYLGVLIMQPHSESAGPAKTAQNVIMAAGFAITFVMAGYIWYVMRGYRKVLLEEQALRNARRAAREVRLHGDKDVVTGTASPATTTATVSGGETRDADGDGKTLEISRASMRDDERPPLRSLDNYDGAKNPNVDDKRPAPRRGDGPGGTIHPASPCVSDLLEVPRGPYSGDEELIQQATVARLVAAKHWG